MVLSLQTNHKSKRVIRLKQQVRIYFQILLFKTSLSSDVWIICKNLIIQKRKTKLMKMSVIQWTLQTFKTTNIWFREVKTIFFIFALYSILWQAKLNKKGPLLVSLLLRILDQKLSHQIGLVLCRIFLWFSNYADEDPSEIYTSSSSKLSPLVSIANFVFQRFGINCSPFVPNCVVRFFELWCFSRLPFWCTRLLPLRISHI